MNKPTLPYDIDTDSYQCPAGQHLDYLETRERRSSAGYESQVRIYEAEDCVGCGLREQCHKSKSNRRIEINAELQGY
ncbi:MAG: transposase [Candidatus Marinimicrobia bacterium]|nr:transposase [Candidatus Neomarinimicrobiota bacterium]